MTAVNGPSGGRNDARLRMVLVRLVECSALVLLLSAAHEMWTAWQNAGFDGFLGRSGPLFLDRVWSVVHNQSRGPVGAALAAVLLAGCLWAVSRLRPLANAPVLRVEVAVLALGGLVLDVAAVAVVVVAATVRYGPDQGPSPLGVGEDRLSVLLPVAAWPLASALLYVALGGAWWLLRAEPVEDEHVDEAAQVGDLQQLGAGERAGVAEQAGGSGGVGGADVPERPTRSGYDDYFRRR